MGKKILIGLGIGAALLGLIIYKNEKEYQQTLKEAEHYRNLIHEIIDPLVDGYQIREIRYF